MSTKITRSTQLDRQPGRTGQPDAEPWRLDFSGAIAPEPLTIDIVR